MREAGLNASVAVLQTSPRRQLMEGVPYLNSWDAAGHAMVVVTTPDGRHHWVDPTWPASSAWDAVSYPNCVCLVLDDRGERFLKTGPANAKPPGHRQTTEVWELDWPATVAFTWPWELIVTEMVFCGMAMPGWITRPFWVTSWPCGDSEKLPERL